MVAGVPHGEMSIPAKHVGASTSAGLHHDNSGWTALGPHKVGGRVRSIVIDEANSNTIWAGSVGGGVFRTDNAGETWEPTEDLMANLAIVSLVRGPALDNSGDTWLYAGTGENGIFPYGDTLPGNGIFISKDGWSWEQIPATKVTDTKKDFNSVCDLALSKSDSDKPTLLATTGTGIFILSWTSAGGGKVKSKKVFTAPARSSTANWGLGDSITIYDNFLNFSVHPSDNKKIIAGGKFGKIKYSTDGGQSWNDSSLPSLPSDTGRIRTTHAKANGNIIYASAFRGEWKQIGGEWQYLGKSQVWVSNDGGENFVQKTNAPTDMLGKQGNYDNVIWAGDPSDDQLVLVGGVDIFRSTDGGDSFARISTWWSEQSAHADQHIMVSDPNNSRWVYFGNDGGIYRAKDVKTVGNNSSAPFTNGWEDLNNFFSVTQFYYGAGDPQRRWVMGGAQDNGTSAHIPGKVFWENVGGGDGMGVAVQSGTDTQEAIWYGSYQKMSIYRATRNGEGNWGKTPISIGLAVEGQFRTLFKLDPSKPQVMYACAKTLSRTGDATASTVSWDTAKSGGDDLITAIAIGNTAGNNGSLSDTVVIGDTGGNIYITSNANSSNAPFHFLASNWKRYQHTQCKPDVPSPSIRPY